VNAVTTGTPGSETIAMNAFLSDETLMGEAINEALRAPNHADVPVGALIVHQGQIIASRHNEREKTNDPTAHAELLAIRDASRSLGTWRLDGANVFCTLEPCAMCASALQQARIARLVYGTADPKTGACGSLYNLSNDPRLNHQFETRVGVRGEECASLLRSFFAARRKF